MPNLGLSAEAASSLGFSELQAAEAQPATPRLAQTLAFGSCEEQTNQLGKQAWSFDPAYSRSFQPHCSKLAGRSHHNPSNFQFTRQLFPLKVLCIVVHNVQV